MNPQLACAIMVVALSALATCDSRTDPEAEEKTRHAAGTTVAADSLPRIPSEIAAQDSMVGGQVANLSIKTLLGAELTLDEMRRGRRGLVIAMSSAECPISRKYAPRLAAIEREFDGQFAFVHINPVDGESAAAIQEALREFGFRGWYARDVTGAARRELKPRTTTEVFVIDGERRLVYRGAIDDEIRLGGSAVRAARYYLREALSAVLAGAAPAIRATEAPGCLVDLPDELQRQPGAATANSITFYPDVAAALTRNCTSCHFPRGPAPFSLASYGDVQGRASMIAAVVREEIMPPNHGLAWKGESPLVEARRISRVDRELLLAWLESARVIGDPSLAPQGDASTAASSRIQDNTWEIGAPDLILTSPGPRMGPDDPPRFGRYLVPVNLAADQWVEAIECRPMMHGSVEVAHVWLIAPGGTIPRAEELPSSAELFAMYSASDRVIRFGPDAARRLPAGSVLVFDLRCRSVGKPHQSQLRIALKFAQTPPEQEVRSVLISAETLAINPGEQVGPGSATMTMTEQARLRALTPIMGPRGKEISVELMIAGGPPVTLLDLRRYDWRWLIRYPVVVPVELPVGAMVNVRACFDNSAANPANPDAAQRLSMGVGPDHEMLCVALEYIVPVKAPPRP